MCLGMKDILHGEKIYDSLYQIHDKTQQLITNIAMYIWNLSVSLLYQDKFTQLLQKQNRILFQVLNYQNIIWDNIDHTLRAECCIISRDVKTLLTNYPSTDTDLILELLQESLCEELSFKNYTLMMYNSEYKTYKHYVSDILHDDMSLLMRFIFAISPWYSYVSLRQIIIHQIEKNFFNHINQFAVYQNRDYLINKSALSKTKNKVWSVYLWLVS